MYALLKFVWKVIYFYKWKYMTFYTNLRRAYTHTQGPNTHNSVWWANAFVASKKLTFRRWHGDWETTAEEKTFVFVKLYKMVPCASYLRFNKCFQLKTDFFFSSIKHSTKQIHSKNISSPTRIGNKENTEFLSMETLIYKICKKKNIPIYWVSLGGEF